MSDYNQNLFAPDILRALDGSGVVGYWRWVFATNEHVWSIGLYRLLGLVPNEVEPSYARLLDCVHPEDRARLETVAGLAGGANFRDCKVRVMGADGKERIFNCRGQIQVRPDGRPRLAIGIVLDVSSQEFLRRILAAEKHRRNALFSETRIFTHSVETYPPSRVPPELVALTGLPEDVIRGDLHQTEIPEERNFWRDHFLSHDRRHRPFYASPTLMMADKERIRFEIISVPIRNAAGKFTEWSVLLRPLKSRRDLLIDDIRNGLEQHLDASHIRAARALLDWSMSDLAGASGVSLASIRRIEEGGGDKAGRSRSKVARALRQAGVQFLLIGSEIAVSRGRSAP